MTDNSRSLRIKQLERELEDLKLEQKYDKVIEFMDSHDLDFNFEPIVDADGVVYAANYVDHSIVRLEPIEQDYKALSDIVNDEVFIRWEWVLDRYNKKVRKDDKEFYDGMEKDNDI